PPRWCGRPLVEGDRGRVARPARLPWRDDHRLDRRRRPDPVRRPRRPRGAGRQPRRRPDPLQPAEFRRAGDHRRASARARDLHRQGLEDGHARLGRADPGAARTPMNSKEDPVSTDYTTLPDDLPEPIDDGAADHLPGTPMPVLTLPATDGTGV